MASRINHLAVLAAAVVFYILGAAWYMSPLGAIWMSQLGKTQTGMSCMVAIGHFVFAGLAARIRHRNRAR